MTEQKRTPVRQKAKRLAKLLRKENPDYDYLRQLFRHLRTELSVNVTHNEKNYLTYQQRKKFVNIIRRCGSHEI